jgi:hypothetical protein
MTETGVPVSRPWLESLSTDELIKLADTYGIDIPPGLERIFIIEELLEITSMDNLEITSDIEENPSYSEAALLPKQYNISYIEVIIRDPLWVFVFWEVKGHDREIHENANDFKGYCLRLIPFDEQNNEPKSNENSFTVSVGAEDCARYLGFTEHPPQDSNCYIVKLGVIRGDNELPIVSSLPFYLPKLSENENIASLCNNPLIRLSGIQDLTITKNTDRQSRIKRQQ